MSEWHTRWPLLFITITITITMTITIYFIVMIITILMVLLLLLLLFTALEYSTRLLDRVTEAVHRSWTWSSSTRAAAPAMGRSQAQNASHGPIREGMLWPHRQAIPISVIAVDTSLHVAVGASKAALARSLARSHADPAHNDSNCAAYCLWAAC